MGARPTQVTGREEHGGKPVSNPVTGSEGPADCWASTDDVSKIGPYPAPLYPETNEEFRP